VFFAGLLLVSGLFILSGRHKQPVEDELLQAVNETVL
jgi:hypothetical protein